MDYPTSSRNHGFQSHVCHNIFRDVLGLKLADPVGKKISVRFSPSELLWCEGTIPVSDGEIWLQWWREEERICDRMTTPPGYTVDIDNVSGRKLERRP